MTSSLHQRLKDPNSSFDNDTEKTEAQKMHKALVSGQNAFFVLSLLSKYNLLNSKTSRLSGKVTELCKYVFIRMTNWDDMDEIGKPSFF